MKPLNENLLIEKLQDSQEIKESGLTYIGNTESVIRGKVVAISNRVEDINVGDIVVFKQQNAETIVLEYKELYLISQEYILALI